MPRFHCPAPIAQGMVFELPEGAARHVQVLRLQPGDAITLFNGEGGEAQALVEQMGRANVRVRIESTLAAEREASREVHLAFGMMASERLDWLVEKATELGVASLQPLAAERSVLRLAAERAVKKQAHWQAVAVAACEQCGRNRIPRVHPVRDLASWLAVAPAGTRVQLSLAADARPLSAFTSGGGPITALSGPEGGFSPAEGEAACAAGFEPVTLGPRILRAETAPLALLAALTVGIP